MDKAELFKEFARLSPDKREACFVVARKKVGTGGTVKIEDLMGAAKSI